MSLKEGVKRTHYLRRVAANVEFPAREVIRRAKWLNRCCFLIILAIERDDF